MFEFATGRPVCIASSLYQIIVEKAPKTMDAPPYAQWRSGEVACDIVQSTTKYCLACETVGEIAKVVLVIDEMLTEIGHDEDYGNQYPLKEALQSVFRIAARRFQDYVKPFIFVRYERRPGGWSVPGDLHLLDASKSTQMTIRSSLFFPEHTLASGSEILVLSAPGFAPIPFVMDAGDA